MEECPKNMQGNGTSRGKNRFMLLKISKSKRIHHFTVYALPDPGVIYLLYVAMNCYIIPEELSEPFSVFTPVCESISSRGSLS